MTDYARMRCEACRAGAPKLTDTEFDALSAQIPDWKLAVQGDVPQLWKKFVFSNFLEAIQFANLIGEEAEKEGHHPALLVEWGSVEVRWWTHKIQGLHKNDVIMAARTDAIAHN